MRTAEPGGFVLASTSPRRLALLAQIGLTPARVLSPEVDETPLPAERPAALARRLAIAKAQAGAAAAPGALVLAADTVVALGRRVLDKPADPDAAAASLRLLSGRAHQVTTAAALAGPQGRLRVRLGTARVIFKRLTDQEIAWHTASEDWRGKAGGYAIQGRAGAFVTAISGSYTAVVGLPLFETAGLLEAAGVPVRRDLRP